MDRKIIWTETATEDLAAIALFIEKDAPFYAAALVRQARAAALSLRRTARRGRIVPECCESEIREIFLKNFRLIYRLADDSVFILAFVHGARDISVMRSKLKT